MKNQRPKDMEDLLKFLLEPLVTDIEKIQIKQVQNGNIIQFTAIVPKDDIAKVIGKEGKMIKSIKNLLKIRAIKENIFVNLEVQEG